jgi:Uma2 family endonuclease
MSTETTDSPRDRWYRDIPEGKLELLGGKLVVSTLAGSRWVLRELLNDYTPDLVLPMVSSHLWWNALEASYSPRPCPATLAEWHDWADQLSYEPEVVPTGPRMTNEHYRMYDLLHWGLYHLGESSGLGRQLGRDFVIRLGENGPTPDLVFIDRKGLTRLRDRYLDGPPAIAIEIVMRGSEEQDRVFKRRLYERAAVPEYWLFDPETPEITFFRLQADGRYDPLVFDARELARNVATGEDSVYRSTAVPGLSLSLRQLLTMEEHDWSNPLPPFLPLPTDAGEAGRLSLGEGGIQWDSIPFRPRVELEPVPIRFDEYASWCGRAKFERYAGGLKIDGTEGSRRVAGMLLMTFGLLEVVRLAHPREWLAFLDRDRYRAAVQQHVESIMRHAKYDRRDYRPDEVFYLGEIPSLPDLGGYGDSLEECERDLTATVERWVLQRIARRETISGLG